MVRGLGWFCFGFDYEGYMKVFGVGDVFDFGLMLFLDLVELFF